MDSGLIVLDPIETVQRKSEIKWREVRSSTDFEDYVLNKLRRVDGGMELQLGQLLSTWDGEDSVRYGIDLKGTYKEKRFVVSARYFSRGADLTEADLKKLQQDAKRWKANRAFVLDYKGRLSEELEKKYSDITRLSIRTPEDTPTHWKQALLDALK